MASRTSIALCVAIALLIVAGAIAAILGAVKTSILIMFGGLILCLIAVVIEIIFY